MGSGTIDTGRELFGDNTLKADGTKAKDGFDALSDLDSNNDGVFNSSDEAFDSVQVWQDKDQDGVSDNGELTSLSDAGIDSIDLNAKTVNKSVAGGILRKTSTVTNADGTTATVGAMDFAENKFYSKFEEVLQSSQDLQNSINVAGQGALRSLHEAASLSPDLNNALKGLYSGDIAITDSAIHGVLLEWVKTSQDFTTSLELLDGYTLEDGTQINVGISDRVKTVIEKTAVLEALNGDRLLDYQIHNRGSSYGVYVETGSEVFNFAGGGTAVSKGGTVTLNDWDFHRLADNARATHISQGYASAFNSIKESVRTNFILQEVQPFLLENVSFEFDAVGEVALSFDGINEAIVEKIKADPVSGMDLLKNVIDAKDVTFLKDGWDSSPLLENGIPEALSEVFNAEVVLTDADKMDFKVDGKLYTIGSLAGTGSADFILGTNADDSILGGNSNDTLVGGEGSDRLYGNNHNDTLDGGTGDDQLYGGSQSDTLTGGAGNDILRGDNLSGSESKYHSTRYNDSRYSRGNDTLAGGKGDDTLFGGYGSDTYIFNKGDGVDTISEVAMNDYYRGRYDGSSRDTVKFGEGLNSEDVLLSISGKDLLVNFKDNAEDQLILKDFMSNNTINNFEFADGTKLDRNNFMSLDTLEGTDGADSISGYGGAETILAGAGDDSISGNSGDDELHGEAGNDTLSGGNNNDILIGGEGSDRLYGNNHNDTLDGGTGDDQLYGGSQSDTLTKTVDLIFQIFRLFCRI